jgi:hypothetical protein
MQPLTKPREELEMAKAEIETMKAAPNLDAFESAWKNYLSRLERVWNKTCAHLSKSGKYQGWVEKGRTNSLRKKDPLLSYLVNARGADEHTVEEITSRTSGGIAINQAFGNSLHINHLSINNGNIFIDSKQPIKIEFIPGKTKLIPVVNRGRTYEPPTTHLGGLLKNKEPIHLAEAGIEFYENFIEKAEEFFIK